VVTKAGLIVLGSYGTVVAKLKIWRRKLIIIACEYTVP